jgi:hypothetical protein
VKEAIFFFLSELCIRTEDVDNVKYTEGFNERGERENTEGDYQILRGQRDEREI